MALTSSLVFQKTAGRFKLEAEDEFRSCFGEVAVAAAREAAKRHRDSRLRRLERSQLVDSKADVLDFLKKHGFNCCREDLRLNMPKKRAFGFRRTYPLHQAVQNQDWPMVKLLLQFGADPTCKDSKGRDLATCVNRDEGPRLDSSSSGLKPAQAPPSPRKSFGILRICCAWESWEHNTRSFFHRAMEELEHNFFSDAVNSLS